ncbi:MAG: NrdH-redoxin [Actinobacteria bacterium RBG_13_35_12]|nr:MAG: NrdH-redoxin [Actinobacteria bacterium RBG_13_35_12]
MKKVLVYTTPTCPYCGRAKEYLKSNNIDVEDIDVSTSQNKLQEMIDKSGQMGVPVLDIEGKIIVGFNKEEIDKALDIK